ncbi:hypothetical protein [Cellulomonas bogoriensis]|uniref:Lipoprotein n=1 Tax=Cellulomonas bogoriensis 69B4 = DSM 16987 TaxID=1386082 RepID=A0A0A0BRR4_9CELL|nr:hypothetical protein [Cellulomonas bogoriensis]KGM10635.1 lipoprotein [Cellulomonas bogoriensis 69B4 = DSM 16987]
MASRTTAPSTTDARARAARRLLAGPVAAALALGLGACSVTNPISTAAEYDGSDGVRAAFDGLRATNLIVLTEAEGAPGTLIGALSNPGSEAHSVTVNVGGAAEESFDLAAGQTVLIGPNREDTLDVTQMPVAPGTNIEIRFTTGSAGSTTVLVPVLDGTFPEYTALVPDADVPEAETPGGEDADGGEDPEPAVGTPGDTDGDDRGVDVEDGDTPATDD